MLIMTLTIKVSKVQKNYDAMVKDLQSMGFSLSKASDPTDKLQDWEGPVDRGLATVDLSHYAARIELVCIDKAPLKVNA